MICGIDEAGRGCIAGPLVAAGVVLKKKIEGLNDSKKLSEKKREILFDQIIDNALYEIIFTDNQTIDQIGLSKAMKHSILQIREKFKDYEIIFDGNTSFGVKGIQTLVKADATIAEVSAASILAKVSRDRYMIEMNKEYPEYLFYKHKGYGTKLHIEKIEQFGLSKLHRATFKIKSLKNSSLF